MNNISPSLSPCIIIVEGNISAGKSTLARGLGELTGFKVFYEPTETNPFLDKFYEDPKKYALEMQLWLLRIRFRIYIEAVNYIVKENCGVILDRSIYSDSVFAEKNFIDGNIDDEGYEYYKQLRSEMLKLVPSPRFAIYLDSSPKVCYNRVHNIRGRGCESSIKLEYLEGLDQCYQNLLQDICNLGTQSMRYDWNQFGNISRVLRDMIDQYHNPEQYTQQLSQSIYIIHNSHKLEYLMPPDNNIDQHKDENEINTNDSQDYSSDSVHLPSSSSLNHSNDEIKVV
eukprot:gb/GECH01002562.1/.p1 GENE.gb/GECH01002562.1/~~gb/GECH01002562.1/.p1  ORF type:complete len:284 (+),score=75.65 gb/GECH01002562.1/:1-852(+)